MADNNVLQSWFNAAGLGCAGRSVTAGQPIPNRVLGEPTQRITSMYKTISAALIAASLIAGPVLAQGTTTTATTPATAATVKADAKAKVKVTAVKKTKKHSA